MHLQSAVFPNRGWRQTD